MLLNCPRATWCASSDAIHWSWACQTIPLSTQFLWVVQVNFISWTYNWICLTQSAAPASVLTSTEHVLCKCSLVRSSARTEHLCWAAGNGSPQCSSDDHTHSSEAILFVLILSKLPLLESCYVYLQTLCWASFHRSRAALKFLCQCSSARLPVSPPKLLKFLDAFAVHWVQAFVLVFQVLYAVLG